MVPPRPKINVLLAIICFWLYIIPGILYVSNIRKKQEEWDKKYLKNYLYYFFIYIKIF